MAVRIDSYDDFLGCVREESYSQDITQADLSRKLSVDESTVSHWYNRRREMRLDTAIAVLKTLGKQLVIEDIRNNRKR